MTMTNDIKREKAEMLKDALRHFQCGLDLLDDVSAPGQIGAHVDLAIHQLESVISAMVEAEPA